MDKRLDQFIERGTWGSSWRYCYNCGRDWLLNRKKNSISCTTFGCKGLAYAQKNNKLGSIYAIVWSAYDDLNILGDKNGTI